MTGLPDRIKSLVWRWRRRWAWFDHLAQAYGRFSQQHGNRHAAAITYVGFLAVFPLVALAFSVLGYVLAGHPALIRQFTDNLNANFPGLVGHGRVIDVARVTSAKASAGLIGLVGLLLAGLGWVEALRASIRELWLRTEEPGNFVIRKLADVGVLVGLGLTLAVSITATGAVSGAADTVLKAVGLQGSATGRVIISVMGYGLTLVVDVVLFLYLLLGLPRLRPARVRRGLSGALIGAVGFQVLKWLGTLYVTRTTSNPLYGTVVLAVGLLVWINLVSRLLLFCAAWTATGPDPAAQSPEGASAAGG